MNDETRRLLDLAGQYRKASWRASDIRGRAQRFGMTGLAELLAIQAGRLIRQALALDHLATHVECGERGLVPGLSLVDRNPGTALVFRRPLGTQFGNVMVEGSARQPNGTLSAACYVLPLRTARQDLKPGLEART
jgi:hypothetical protein